MFPLVTISLSDTYSVSAGECVTFPLMVYQISAKQQQRQKTGKGSFKAGADTGVGRSDFAPP